MTTSMLLTTTALIAGLLAAGVTSWAMRLRAQRDVAAVATERDLLRERVVDLEAALTEDAQTAAALAPLGETIARVERQVGVLERDRT
ncbi:MAG: DNA recombination protein RmuC, partial [Dermatophilaceae bacterium]